ncbi:GNAT family N-acetyltransferase [Amycolatopsis jiangsuensis]|uniref:GNAT superfamily N-acetyltransferase n=1 Tax=Amycolatopsis jiangsuensis TaxID=1181879 RepID=A0A840J5F4_9PSEU|nr:GNAT family N-acetyltransferase [Amycolatopsis jiangsuensis]MBB4688662.1 GNAT superfamily N-acetyltransferase [Amycolatopsis jiangsuensis]
MIRLATPTDLPLLTELERAAGAVFRDVGMAAIADDEPASPEQLAVFQTGGRCWVYEEDARPAGYVLAAEVDGFGHVEQVSVRPEHTGRGLGRRLIDTVGEWAVAGGLPGLTLTTFTDVPWNGPYYARLGFCPLPPEEQGPHLRAIRQAEIDRGLDRWPRMAMLRLH